MPALAPPPLYAAVASTKAETSIVREINRVRRAHHLRSVRLNAPLARVARRHSAEMLQHDLLTHSSFDGRSFATRVAGAGRHRTHGETLAWMPNGTAASAGVVVGLWMQSAAHRVVLMNGALRRVGVGRVHGSMGAQAGNAITADFSS